MSLLYKTAKDQDSPKEIEDTTEVAKRPKSSALKETTFDGQLLQSSRKKKQPRYNPKIDPTIKRPNYRGRGANEAEDDGCCDNATPC